MKINSNVARINVIIETDMYLKIIKVRSEIQKENPTKIITFTDAVKFVIEKGLQK